MATDIERLVVQLSADFKSFEREMQRASGISARQARAIENNFRSANRQLDSIGRSMAASITGPLAGIAAGLGTREILRYAEAWTTARNSLAVAGVTGAKQSVILDELFRSAQSNGAPLSALTTLYGRAAQVSTELGASQSDLLRFTDGVATALRVAGTDAGQASGALLQLGQALGSAKVQAEEFNSINEGARPILQAVAAGMDAAGGSVARLKTLVNDGKVSNREFFEAFLRGLPTIQAQAANASQTISQAYTKISNALTRYIGESDEGLGATQRLVVGLNALANNFNTTADVVLRVAAVIAAGLIGRAIGPMIVSLGLGTAALIRFAGALRGAASFAAVGSAFGGLAAAAGPIGFLIGTVVVGALALFSTQSRASSEGARLYAEAVKQIEAESRKAAPAVGALTGRMREQETLALNQALKAQATDLANVRAEMEKLLQPLDYLRGGTGRNMVAPEALQALRDLRERLREGSIGANEAKERLSALANANPGLVALANALNPLIDRLATAATAATRLQQQLAGLSASSVPNLIPPDETANARSRSGLQDAQLVGAAIVRDLQRRNSLTSSQLDLETKIAEIRKEVEASGGVINEQTARRLAQDALSAEERRKKESQSGSSTRQRRTTDDAFNREIQQIKDRTAALVLEQEIVGRGVAEQERRRMELELEQQALRRLQDAARQNGDTNWRNIQLSQQQRDAIKQVAAAYGEQAAALQRVQENQQRAQQAAEEFYSAAKQGFIDSITGAKNLGDAIGNIAKKLGDLLIGGAFDALFKPAGGGGLFGGILKLFGGGGGGGLNPFALFSDGGYTGDGGKYQPAGTVHRGEYVFSKEATRRAGVGNLEAMHRSLKGYATGGLVGGAAPRPPTIPAMLTQGGSGRGATVVQMGDTIIDARNSSLTEAQFRSILAENNKQVLSMVPAAVMKARGSRDLDTRR